MVLKFDAIFGDKLVLPIGKSFGVSGWSAVKSKIEVSVGQQNRTTISSKTGRWHVQFDPINDGLQVYSIRATDGTDSISLHELRFGLVLLLAGQSNIEYEMKDDSEYQFAKQQDSQSAIYYYNVPKIEYVGEDGTVLPDDLPVSRWKQLSSENMGELSAIGYWMSQSLKRRLPGTVIGIVDCYKGGTSISSWVPKSTLENNALLAKTFVKPFEVATSGKTDEDYQSELHMYRQKVAQHNYDLATFQAAHPDVSLSDAKKKVGHTPWPPPMTPTSFLRPGGLYQTMVRQIRGYTFNQVIWYQGENDAQQPDVYQTMLAKLIQSWRKMLADSSLIFNVIQLPGYADEPFESWAKIRQAQLSIAQMIPNVNLISGSDTGERHNIHPTSKRKLGERIGRLVSNQGYSQTPLVIETKLKGNDVIIGIGQVNQLKIDSDTKMMIKIGNEWVPRQVKKLDEQHIILKDCSGAAAVRYQYVNYPEMTIFNELGDPLTPFSCRIGIGG
ncbi:sialate O-acetylesterase [Lactiplantibacillus pentosus]|uniref:sialate O-acetylesterase n=1 Tax=Lactiplantibacillus TaxID=2767842 RepID=UPI001B0D61F8|nr:MULTISPECIES: sialate O-acetylesterase [Lactiplantibacillus]MBU7485098.1 hypothetical protein [Lactiplantibacillus sp. 30.2.29]MBU7488304.1 hypothetical protein [Lactiplantibacillus pentosus]MBU7501406.1 hypothetical protein [Lactiplantibacillus pentosus]MBU7507995.1 hypothetical protein [Lactiplantibacillus pentosus]MBU7511151.1 hypothetical protein [Lactiplantibacillus pentosus]